MVKESFKANPLIIKFLAKRTKCLLCKHRKAEGHILPRGKYYPSPAWLLHYEDTHGLAHDIFYEWLYLTPYGELLKQKWGKI